MRKLTELAVMGCLFAGCAPVIPKELVNARTAYGAMQRGAVAGVSAEEAQRARTSLSRAEQSYADEGASQSTRELSIAAERDAINAQAACLRAGGTPEIVTVEKTPEERLRDVLTAVPGTVMFEFDKSTLLPAARERLDQLATALKDAQKTDHPQTITVAGYADSKGPAEYNVKLSERRANAVKDYLSSKGYDPNLVQVRAMGETHPFTTNATQEGRSNNRRVEIFLGEKKMDEPTKTEEMQKSDEPLKIDEPSKTDEPAKTDEEKNDE
jgi:outer membrane protein OmpA-like peptidoglycan-associated protein